MEITLNSMTVLMLLSICVMSARQARPALALLSQHTIPVLPPHAACRVCFKPACFLCLAMRHRAAVHIGYSHIEGKE